MDNWLDNANHHYYALYPPQFRAQYQGWSAARNNGETVSVELTSLIARICASSTQFLPLDGSLKLRLESELRGGVSSFNKRMHAVANKLNKCIPTSRGTIIQVQQAILAAYWYKCEELWVDAWHELGKAMSVAYELGRVDILLLAHPFSLSVSLSLSLGVLVPVSEAF